MQSRLIRSKIGTLITNCLSLHLQISYESNLTFIEIDSLLQYLICEKFSLDDKRKCYCNFLPNLNFTKKVSCRNAATQIQDHDRSRNWFRQRKSNDDDIMISLHRLLLYVFMMIVKIFLVQKCFSYNMKSNALGSNFLLSWISKQSIEGRSQNLVYDLWISHFGLKKKL